MTSHFRTLLQSERSIPRKFSRSGEMEMAIMGKQPKTKKSDSDGVRKNEDNVRCAQDGQNAGRLYSIHVQFYREMC